MDESPGRALSKSQWLSLFRDAGFMSDVGSPPPTGPLEVWRAQMGHVYGMAWTLDEAVARWYFDHKLESHRSRARLFRGVVEPDGVLAFFEKGRVPLQAKEGRLEAVGSGPGESEVVIDPAKAMHTDTS